jgi:hypothetical protein
VATSHKRPVIPANNKICKNQATRLLQFARRDRTGHMKTWRKIIFTEDKCSVYLS